MPSLFQPSINQSSNQASKQSFKQAIIQASTHQRTVAKGRARGRYIDAAPEARRGRHPLPVKARMRQTGKAGVQR